MVFCLPPTQNLRKSAGLEISDRIRLYVDAHERVAEALRGHEDYVKGETLANTLELSAPPRDANTETHKLDGAEVMLGVVKE